MRPFVGFKGGLHGVYGVQLGVGGLWSTESLPLCGVACKEAVHWRTRAQPSRLVDRAVHASPFAWFSRDFLSTT